MSAFQIKLLAIITMLIDHIGLYFFPEHAILRVIGRLSFPLFAWLIANGAYHTRNMRLYFLRLLFFAILSQIPFAMANQLINIPGSLNIFFTLSIGLGAIILLKKASMNIHKLLIVTIAATIATYLNTDYGAFGVLCIILFYVFFHNKKQLLLAQSTLFIGTFVLGFIYPNVFGIIEIFGLLSLFFIFLYNGEEGMKMKYLFYVIYPLQYVIYYLFLKR